MSGLLSGLGMGSNPFSSPIGQRIEKATEGANASENWGLYMEICDMINGNDDLAKDAVKAIRKRFHSSPKNHKVVMYTLTALETCVKNCGRKLHVQVANKDFLSEMTKLLAPKNDPPQAVQEKVLSLIQTWSDAFKGQPELREVEKYYDDMRAKGIEFPMTDLDHMAPIYTPARSVPEPPRQPPRQPVQYQPPPQVRMAAAPQHPQHPPQQHPQMAPPGPPGPDHLAKLRSQLDTVEGNVKIFNEMLTELQPGSAASDDWELMQQLAATCRAMQERLMTLLQQIQHEDVTGELLRINDDMNNVFVRWERFERGRPQQQQAHPTPQAPSAASVSAPGRPAPQQQVVPPPSHAPAPPANLIDFGDDPSLAPPPPAAAGVTQGMAGLSLSSGAGQQPPRQANDDFDMFAQSRQSFEQNSRAPPDYSSQQQSDMTPGLASAVAARAEGIALPPELADQTADFDEMERWLTENDPKEGGTQPTMTSSEFDRFLTERAQGEQGSGGAANASRRTLQKEDDRDTMFAL